MTLYPPRLRRIFDVFPFAYNLPSKLIGERQRCVCFGVCGHGRLAALFAFCRHVYVDAGCARYLRMCLKFVSSFSGWRDFLKPAGVLRTRLNRRTSCQLGGLRVVSTNHCRQDVLVQDSLWHKVEAKVLAAASPGTFNAILSRIIQCTSTCLHQHLSIKSGTCQLFAFYKFYNVSEESAKFIAKHIEYELILIQSMKEPALSVCSGVAAEWKRGSLGSWGWH